jgi:hypothetical protein
MYIYVSGVSVSAYVAACAYQRVTKGGMAVVAVVAVAAVVAPPMTHQCLVQRTHETDGVKEERASGLPAAT